MNTVATIGDGLPSNSEDLPNLPKFVLEARLVAPKEGQVIEGTVLRLPGRGIYSGNRLFLQTSDGEAICVLATGKTGWGAIERSLEAESVKVGDRVAVRFRGWRITKDGERRYRWCDVMILAHADGDRRAA